MRTVGIFEAKTRLSELVAEVEAGETILLTKNGRPVAEIVAAPVASRQAREAVDWIFANRPRKPMGDLRIRELIDEGRRF